MSGFELEVIVDAVLMSLHLMLANRCLLKGIYVISCPGKPIA
jgi:hypothetical protein